MAPKKTVPSTDGGHVANKKKIPVAVKAARDKMEALQAPLTATSLKDMLTAKEFNNLGNSFRNSLTPDEKTTYGKGVGRRQPKRLDGAICPRPICLQVERHQHAQHHEHQAEER